MSIITYPLESVTHGASDVQTYVGSRTSGVYADEDCFDISITDDMEVTVSTGLAWIKNGDFDGKCVYMDESVSFSISLGSGIYSRTDRVVLKYDSEENVTTIEVQEGTPSSSADPPDIERTDEIYELGLYEIYVAAGTTELESDDITDTRTDEDLCGIIGDGVTEIPTKVLKSAADELIDTLQEQLDAAEENSDYMLKSTYDSEAGEKQVAFKEDIGELIDEYLPFTLAVSDDGEYGYYDLEGNFQTFKSAVGDATEADVLSGVTFSSAEVYGGTGTMENQGAVSSTLNAGSSYTIPEGYHNGSGTVTANSLSSQTNANATAARILNGYTAYVNGSKITGNMTNRGNVTATVNAGNSYTISAGYHGGGGTVTANSLSSQTNANATAARILNGYTAYVNGSKITGNMASRGNVNSNIAIGGSYTISAGYHAGGGKIYVNKPTIYSTTFWVNQKASNGNSTYFATNYNCYLANNTFVTVALVNHLYNTNANAGASAWANLNITQSGNVVTVNSYIKAYYNRNLQLKAYYYH